MKVICRDGRGRSGYARRHGTGRRARSTRAAIAARAAAKLARRRARRRSRPGEYPVVLDADAVGVLLEFLGALAFNGLAHAEGRGALAGRLGERVAAPAINLSDSPRFRARSRAPSTPRASPRRRCR